MARKRTNKSNVSVHQRMDALKEWFSEVTKNKNNKNIKWNVK